MWEEVGLRVPLVETRGYKMLDVIRSLKEIWVTDSI
jgi:hypothetical protein